MSFLVVVTSGGSHLWSGFEAPVPKDAQVPREFRDRLSSQRTRVHKSRDTTDTTTTDTTDTTDTRSEAVRWCTTDYEPGDVVIFNIKTLHAAAKNCSAHYRVRSEDRVIFPLLLVIALPLLQSRHTLHRARRVSEAHRCRRVKPGVEPIDAQEKTTRIVV